MATSTVTSSAYYVYDTELMTNYVQSGTTTPAKAPAVQSYTLNVQAFDKNNLALSKGSAIILASTSIPVSLNGQVRYQEHTVEPLAYRKPSR